MISKLLSGACSLAQSSARCELGTYPVLEEGLARSTYYYRCRQKSTQVKKEEADLRGRIDQIVVEAARYGYRRVTYQLRREGYKVNHKRVARRMREQSLQCQIKRRWVKTTDSDHGYRTYPNLIKGLGVKGRNQVWVADITYIRIWQYACHACVRSYKQPRCASIGRAKAILMITQRQRAL